MGRAPRATPPPGEPTAEAPENREVVFLTTSHGARAGEKRDVSAKKAASLVGRGLARYSPQE